MKNVHTLSVQILPVTYYLFPWFDERPKIGIRLPFCGANEVESRKFVKKLNTYTKLRFNFVIILKTRKMESIFKLKDKNPYPSHVIYKGECICGQTYVGETARNLGVRVNGHSDVMKQSEPAKHWCTSVVHQYGGREIV